MKKLSNRLLSLAIAFVMIVTSFQGNFSLVMADESSAADYYLMINGERVDGSYALHYGDDLTFSVGNAVSGDEISYAVRPASGGDWTPVTSGRSDLVPGDYDFMLSVTSGASGEYQEYSYTLNVSPAQLSQPTGLVWTVADDVVSLSWDPTTTTTTNASYDISSAVAGYELILYKDGQVFKSWTGDQKISTAGYPNIGNYLVAKDGGAGRYTYTVSAIPADPSLYQASSLSSDTGYSVVHASISYDNGFVSASFNGPESIDMLPGHSAYSLTSTVKDSYQFASWTGEGVTFGDASAASTTVSLSQDYKGSSEITISAHSQDITAPVIESYAEAKSSEASENTDILKATAKDEDEGIAAYAFSTADDAASVSESAWTAYTDETKESHDFTYAPKEAGSYYFYAKDASGNVAKSGAAVEVTEVNYVNYNGSETLTDYFVGASYTLRSDFTRSSYDYDGLYSDEACTDPAPASLTEHKAEGYSFYIKWVPQSVKFTEDLETEVTKTYSAEGVTLSVALDNTGEIAYQWYKDGQAIEGENSSSLKLKNVSDSGSYYVTATLENKETGTSTTCVVTISKKAITARADDKNVPYGGEAPEYTYSVLESGLEEGDSLGQASYTCAYKAGDPAGDYPITLSGLKNDNYDITFAPGTLTVGQIDISEEAEVSFKDDVTDLTYTGSAIEPALTVTYGDLTLTEGTDYSVTYESNINVGTALARVTFKGNYSGEKTLDFTISRAKFEASVLVSSYIYNGKTPEVSISTNPGSGSVTYLYAAEEDGTYSETAPTDAGTYYVKAEIAETDNYEGLTTPAVSFTISPVEITLTTASHTWTFDGTEHKDTGYSYEGQFVGGDSFKYVTATGAITNAGSVENTADYALSDGTNADNYDIRVVNGTLTITAGELTVPSNVKWGNAGRASWTAVSKTDLVTSYALELYADDGTKINDETLTATVNHYDFSSLIKAYAADHPEAGYYFTIQTLPSDGANKDNYEASEVSEKVGPIYTATVTAIAGDEGIASAEIAGGESLIMIEGETASLSALAKDGYHFLGWLTLESALKFTEFDKADTTLTVSGLTESLKDAGIAAVSQDDDPVIVSYTAENTDSLDKVVLSFSLYDMIGLKAYAITSSGTSEPADSDWVAIDGGQDYQSSVEVDISHKGDNYLWVMDTDGNMVACTDPITIYEIKLVPGEGEGEDISLIKCENSTITLPACTYTKTDYAFKNWSGATGLYPDEGRFSANSDDTLTALWTDEIYTYSVDYYYQDLDGQYVYTETKTYTDISGREISYDKTSIQQKNAGFSLASDNGGYDKTITLTEDGLKLSVCYSRNPYTITYRYTDPDLNTHSSEVTYLYGADISAAFEDKPSLEGYDFQGWILTDVEGGTPTTMPAQNITATGSFTAKQATYRIVYYEQNLIDGDGTGETASVSDYYTLMEALEETKTGSHGEKLYLTEADALEIDGFTFAGYEISSGSVSGATLPADVSREVTGTVSAVEGQDLVINCYYTRNINDMTLNVWEGSLKTGADGSVSGDSLLYNKTWQIPYGATIDPTWYATYDSDKWGEKASDGAVLIKDYTGWSTGSAPTTMPEGDAQVTRQYSKNYTCTYTVEVYMEDDAANDAEPTFTRQASFEYSASLGQTVTVGPDASYTVNFNDSTKGFGKYIRYFSYYDFDSDNAGNITSLVVSEEAEDNVLKVYFERKTVPVTINYYYEDDTTGTSGTRFAQIVKNLKWGHKHTYDVEELAYFYGSESFNEDHTVTIENTTKSGYDFRTNAYVASYRGSYVIDDAWKYPSNSSTYASSTWQTTSPVEVGYSGNTINVYYVKTYPLSMYYLDIMLRTGTTSGGSVITGHSGEGSTQLTYEYEGETYKIRVANDAYFYDGVTFVGEGTDEYPGLRTILVNDNKYVYNDSEDYLKEGYTKVTIGSYTCYLDKDGRYLYVADQSNRFFSGNLVSYSYGTDAPGYEIVTDFISQHQSATDSHAGDNDSAARRLALWNRSYGLTTFYVTDTVKSQTLTITLYYRDPTYLYYNYAGATCYQHTYSPGDVVEEFDCPHLTFDYEGYTVYWYMDQALTTRAQAPYTMGESSTTVYGNYEHTIYCNTEYAYYELPESVIKDGTSYRYITENDLAVFEGDDKLTVEETPLEVSYATDTGTLTETVTVTTWSYDGHVVMIKTPVYATSYQTLSMDLEAYAKEGYTFDTANTANFTSAYLIDEAATLRAYFKVNKNDLTVDLKDNSNPTTVTKTYASVTDLGTPKRGGYDFDGWKFYVTDEDGSWVEWTDASSYVTGTVLTMPDYAVKAEATWKAAALTDTEIFHFYQNVAGDYSDALVRELYQKSGTAGTITVNGTEVSGILYYEGDTVVAVAVADADAGLLSLYQASGDDPTVVTSVDLIGTVEKTSSLVSEEEVTVADHLQKVTGYTYSQTLYRAQDEAGQSVVETLTDKNDTFIARYGMEVSYYYQLIRDINVRAVVAMANEDYDESVANITGTGRHYYSEEADLTVHTADGYTALAWYKAEDVLADYDPEGELGHTLKEGYESASPVATGASYTASVTEDMDLVALVQADPVAEPAVSLSGITALTYGYAYDKTNILKASAAFPEDAAAANKVNGYQWYRIETDEEGNILYNDDGTMKMTALEGETAASYIIPTGLTVGTYKYTCAVTAGRYDNDQVVTVYPEEPHTLVISPAEILVAESGSYEGYYDGQDHSITVEVKNVDDPADYTIYYAEEELTADNYETAGSLTNPAYKNVNVVDGERVPYTVYFYVKSNNENYTDTSGFEIVNIKPVHVTLGETTTVYSKVYDGNDGVSGTATDPDTDLGKLAQGGCYTVEGLIAGETANPYIIDCTATFNSKDVVKANSVRLSDIKLVNKDDGALIYNYIFDDTYTVDLSAYITPCPVEVEWSGTDAIVYDGTTLTPEATISNRDELPASERDFIDVTVSGGQVNVGNYSAQAEVVTSNESILLSNYAVSSGSKAFSISPRPLTLTPILTEVTYNGQPQTVVGCTMDNLVDNHHCDFDINKTYTDAGYYYDLKAVNTKITDANGAPMNSNYDITEATGTLIISKREVTVSGIKAKDKVYDGTTAVELDLSEAVIENVVDGESLTLDPTKVTGEFVTADAGEDVTVKLTFADGALVSGNASTKLDNYVLNTEDSQTETAADITKKVITVTAKDASITYGDEAVTGDNATFTADFSGFADGDTEDVIKDKDKLAYLVTVGDAKKAYDKTLGAGSYEVTPDASALSADNYTFEVLPATLTVEKREVAIKGVDSVEKVYDGTNEAAITEDNYAFGNLVNGDSLTLSDYTAVYDDENVGTGKTVTVTYAAITSDNYKLPEATTFTLENCAITKAPLTVRVKDMSITYGAETDPTYSVTYEGFVNGEEETVLGGDLVYSSGYDCADEAKRGAGTYVVSASGLTSDNYSLTYEPGTLTVGKKTLTLTPEAKNTPYSYGSEFVEADELTYVTAGLAYEDTEAAFTGTAAYTISGLTTTEVDGKDLISSAAGNYVIKLTMGDFTSDNYTVTFKNGSLAVSKLALSIVPGSITVGDRVYDGTTEVYDDQIQKPALTSTAYAGLLDMDIAYMTEHDIDKDAAITVTGAYRDKDAAEDKTVDLTVSLCEYLNARYAFNESATQTTATSTITKRPLKIVADDKEIKFGEDAPTFTATYTYVTQEEGEGLVSSEDAKISSANVTLTSDYKKGDPVTTEDKTYTITVSAFTSDAINVDNYEVTYVNGELKVINNKLSTPAPVWTKNDPAKAGLVSWEAVPAVQGIGVKDYRIALYKDGSETPVTDSEKTLSADTLTYDYTELIRTNGEGAYTVKVMADPVEEGNTDPVNVYASDWGSSDSLYAAKVTFVYASDGVTQAGKGQTITVKDEESYVVIAGETDIPISAALKNETGYTIKSVTASPAAISVKDGTDASRSGATYASTISASTDLAATSATVTLALSARPATLKVSLSADKDSVVYGYQTAPVITAAAAPDSETDNITADDYDYTYSWKLYTGSTQQETLTGEASSVSFPLGKSFGVNKYVVGVTVTATRKDNGESTTVTLKKADGQRIDVTKGAYAPAIVDYSGWTYGEPRIYPVDATKDEGGNLSEIRENAAVTFYYSASGDEGSYTTDIPTEAGTYYIYAALAETANYQALNTQPVTFEIKKAVLDTPEGLTNDPTEETHYGQISWNDVEDVEENDGAADSAATVDTYYAVTLEKQNLTTGDWETFKTYDRTQSLSMDIHEDLQSAGVYRFTVQAVTNKESDAANCEDSKVATSEPFLVGGQISVTGRGSYNDDRTVYTQTYDGENIALTASYDDTTEGLTFQWYKDGQKIEGETAATLNEKFVSDSGSYTCEISKDGTTYSSPYVKLVVNKRAVTLSADAKTSLYGNALDDEGAAVGTLTYTDAGTLKVVKADGENPDLTVTLSAKDSQGDAVSASTAVGTYDILISYNKDDDIAANYTVTLNNATYTIRYLETSALATVSGTMGNNNWFTSTVTLTAPEGYKISTSLDGPYTDTITIEPEGVHDIAYYLEYQTPDSENQRPKTDLIEKALYEGSEVTEVSIDETHPAASITVKDSSFKSVLNAITFGLFFKETQDGVISADDTSESTEEVSGIAAISYAKTTKETDPTTISDWTEGYTGGDKSATAKASLSPDETVILYARIEDKAGHVTYVSTTGIVMYTDAVKDTSSVTYTKTSNADKTSDVKANGNTIKSVTVDGKALTEGTDYTVSYTEGNASATITLKGTYLDTLSAGANDASATYTAVVAYYPQGITTEISHTDVTEEGNTYAYSDNEDPATTSFDIVIEKATPVITITNDPSKVYDGTVTDDVTYTVTYPNGTSDTDSAKVTYYLVKGDNRELLTGKPSGAGTYVAVVTRDADENYKSAGEETTFTISKRAVTLAAKDAKKTYDGQALTESGYALSGGTSLGTGDSIESLKMTAQSTITDAGKTANEIDLSSILIRSAKGVDVTASYEISLTAGELVVDPATPVITAPSLTGDKALTYTAKPAVYAAEVTLVNDETFTGTISYAYSTDGGQTYTEGLPTKAGIYLIKATTEAFKNYTAAEGIGKLEILKKAVTISLDDQSKTYGEADPALTYTITGDCEEYKVAADDLVISREKAGTEEGEQVGTYEITGKASDQANENYTYSFVPAKEGADKAILTINKKAVTVTAEDKTKYYGEADPALTFKTEGDLASDPVKAKDVVLTRTDAGTTEGETVGIHKTIVPTASNEANPNYSYTFVTGTMTISYVPSEKTTPATLVPESGVKLYEIQGSDSFYDGNVDLTAPEGYEISYDKDTGYTDKLALTEEGKSTYTYYVKNKTTGAVSEAMIVATRDKADGTGTETVSQVYIDKTAPTGTIYVGKAPATSLDALIHSLFYKDEMTVYFAASDDKGDLDVSGIKSLEYQKVAVGQTYDATDATWTLIDNPGSFKVTAEDESLYYARITDYTGHVTIINSMNEVVYKDAEQDTESISYVRTSGEDKTASVKTNGNTIKAISDGSKTLTAGTDYTVTYAADGETAQITFTDTYLETKAASTTPYTLTISYDPMGHDKNVTYGDDSSPADTTISLTVEKVRPTIEMTNDPSQIYDGNQVKDATYQVTYPYDKGSDTTSATVTYYRVNGTSRELLNGKPRNVGSYVAVATREADDNYMAASAEKAFTITKREICLVAKDAAKVYDAQPLTETGYFFQGGTSLGTNDAITALKMTAESTITNAGTVDNVIDTSTIRITATIDGQTYDVTNCYSFVTVKGQLQVVRRPIELSWSADTLYHTGQPRTVTAQVTNAQSETDTFTLVYEDNVKTEVGNYTAKVTDLGNSNYTLYSVGLQGKTYEPVGVTHDWKIIYPDEKATLSGPTKNDSGWYTGAVTLTPPEGWEISTDKSVWSDSLTYSDNGETTVVYYLKEKETGHLTDQIKLTFKIDSRYPTGKIEVGKNAFESFLENITFGYFFKDKTTVTITAEDVPSGVASIEYQKIAKDGTFDPEGEWTTYASFDMEANDESVIYARITDVAGNVTLINTDGLVVYMDAEADTEEVTYTRTTGLDKTADVTLRGNTIKALADDERTLEKDKDYTVSEDGKTITLTAAYLETKAAGSYTMTVSYAPLGYDEADIIWGDDGRPSDTTFTLKVEKQKAEVQNLSLEDKTYDGQTCEDPTYDLVDADGRTVPKGDITIEYRMVKNADGEPFEGSEFTTAKPVDAGTYEVRVTRAEDGDYEETSATSEFTVSKKILTAEVTAEERVYDATTDAVVSATVDTGVEGETITLEGLTGVFADPNAGENKTVLVDASQVVETAGEDTKLSNYTIIYPNSIDTGIIDRKDISSGTVKLGDLLKENGGTQTQKVVSVTIDGLTATYDVTGNTGKAAGVYYMDITGNGNFCGNILKPWVIAAADSRIDEVGNIIYEMVVHNGAPETETANEKGQMIQMTATADDLSLVADGDTLRVWLEVTDITGTISSESRALLEAAAGDYTIGDYIDISLFKQLASETEATRLTSTEQPVVITITIPESLINHDSSVTREYEVIRNHQGNAMVLPVTYDEAAGTLTFETDVFSDYAIAYKDTRKEEPTPSPTPTPTPSPTPDPNNHGTSPKTGDENAVWLWVMLLFVSGGALAGTGLYRKKKRS